MPVYELDESKAKLHIAKGNDKIGKTIHAFSTLPGNGENLLVLKDGRVLTVIPGTCSRYCVVCFHSGCYAVSSAIQHHNQVIRAWGENTLLLRNGKLWGLLREYLKANEGKVKLFRINVSGEVQSGEELEKWNEIALENPGVQFGLYTKNFEALEWFIDKHGDTAANFVINVSQWHGVADAILRKLDGKCNVFEYDDSMSKGCELPLRERQRLAKEAHCPAVDAKGHHAKDKDGKAITCDRCGRCYRKTGKLTAVYAH